MHADDGTLYNDGSKYDSLILAPYDPGKIVNYEVEADMKAVPSHCPLGFGIIVYWKNKRGLYSVANCHGRPVELWAGPLEGATRIARRPFTMRTGWLTYRLRVQGTTIVYSVSDGNHPPVLLQVTKNSVSPVLLQATKNILHGNQGGQIGLWTHNDQFFVRDFKIRALP
jgi:hypothetical protein